eukprot:GHVN01059074.1.p1 GENE.GHVN01059074.1~~GHVN01059074.1.p1  ORF type:complete len:2213 (+),score=338.01 GHVN01059074.1:122-6760(+)
MAQTSEELLTEREYVWPSGLRVSDVQCEHTKSRLCVIIKNKHPAWNQTALLTFLHQYFHLINMQCGMAPPEIADIACPEELHSHIATVACSNEASCKRLLALRYIPIPSEWADWSLPTEDGLPANPYCDSNVNAHSYVDKSFTGGPCLVVVPWTLFKISQPSSCELGYYVPPPYIISVQTMLNYQVQLKLRENVGEAGNKAPAEGDPADSKGVGNSNSRQEMDGDSDNDASSEDEDTVGAGGIPASEILGDGTLWPPQVRLQGVADELKGRLCVFVDNKPAVWDQGVLFRYLRDYFYQRYMIDGKSPPLIADISAYQDKTSAIVVLRDEMSVARMFECQHIELPPDHQASSSGSMSSFLFVRQFVPASHRDRPQKTKTNEAPRWVRNQFQYYNTYRSSLPPGGVFQNAEPVFWPEPKMINEVHASLPSRLCVEVHNVPSSWDETFLSNMFFRSLWSMQQEIGLLPPNISAMQCTGDGRAIIACSDELSVHRLLSLRVVYTHSDWSKARPNNLNPNDYLLFAPFTSGMWSDVPLPTEEAPKPSPTWPCDMAYQDVWDSKLKSVLCCCIKNKPAEWTAPILQRYAEEYFRAAGVPVPSIVGIALPTPHMAIFCCYDEHSVYNLLQIGQLLLPPDWAVHNEREMGQAGNVMSVVEFRTENAEVAKKGDEKALAIRDKEGQEASKACGTLAGVGTSADRTQVVWPAGKALREVTDVNLRCRLCLFVFNKPIDWDGITVQRVLEEHAAMLANEFKFTKPSIQLVATVPKAAYALVACSDESSREHFLKKRFVHLPSTDAQQNKERGFPPYFELVPLSRGSDWGGIKARFGAAVAQTSGAYVPPAAPKPAEVTPTASVEVVPASPDVSQSLLPQYEDQHAHRSGSTSPSHRPTPAPTPVPVMAEHPSSACIVSTINSLSHLSVSSPVSGPAQVALSPIEPDQSASPAVAPHDGSCGVNGPPPTTTAVESDGSSGQAASPDDNLSHVDQIKREDGDRGFDESTVNPLSCGGESVSVTQTSVDVVTGELSETERMDRVEQAVSAFESELVGSSSASSDEVMLTAKDVDDPGPDEEKSGGERSGVVSDMEMDADQPNTASTIDTSMDGEADMETDGGPVSGGGIEGEGEASGGGGDGNAISVDHTAVASGLVEQAMDAAQQAVMEQALTAMAANSSWTSSMQMEYPSRGDQMPVELYMAMQYAQQAGVAMQYGSVNDMMAAMQAAYSAQTGVQWGVVDPFDSSQAVNHAAGEGDDQGDRRPNAKESAKSSLDQILAAVRAHKSSAQAGSKGIPVSEASSEPAPPTIVTADQAPAATTTTPALPAPRSILLPGPAATAKAVSTVFPLAGRLKAARGRGPAAAAWHSSGAAAPVNPGCSLTWIPAPVSSTITNERARSPDSSTSPGWQPRRRHGRRGRRRSSSRSSRSSRSRSSSHSPTGSRKGGRQGTGGSRRKDTSHRRGGKGPGKSRSKSPCRSHSRSQSPSSKPKAAWYDKVNRKGRDGGDRDRSRDRNDRGDRGDRDQSERSERGDQGRDDHKDRKSEGAWRRVTPTTSGSRDKERRGDAKENDKGRDRRDKAHRQKKDKEVSKSSDREKEQGGDGEDNRDRDKESSPKKEGGRKSDSMDAKKCSATSFKTLAAAPDVKQQRLNITPASEYPNRSKAGKACVERLRPEPTGDTLDNPQKSKGSTEPVENPSLTSAVKDAKPTETPTFNPKGATSIDMPRTDGGTEQAVVLEVPQQAATLPKRARSPPEASPSSPSQLSEIAQHASPTDKQVPQPQARNALFSGGAAVVNSSNSALDANAKRRRTELAQEWAKAQAAQAEQASPSAIIPVILSTPTSPDGSPTTCAPASSVCRTTSGASSSSPPKEKITQTATPHPLKDVGGGPTTALKIEERTLREPRKTNAGSSTAAATSASSVSTGKREEKVAEDRKKFEFQLIEYLSLHPLGIDISSLRKAVSPSPSVSETLRDFLLSSPGTFVVAGLHVSLTTEAMKQKITVGSTRQIDEDGVLQSSIKAISLSKENETSAVPLPEPAIATPERARFNKAEGYPEVTSGTPKSPPLDERASDVDSLLSPPIAEGRLRGYQWKLVKAPGAPSPSASVSGCVVGDLRPLPAHDPAQMRSVIDSLVLAGVEKHLRKWDRKQTKSLQKSSKVVKTAVKGLKQKVRTLTRKVSKGDARIAHLVQSLAERGVSVPDPLSDDEDDISVDEMSGLSDSDVSC